MPVRSKPSTLLLRRSGRREARHTNGATAEPAGATAEPARTAAAPAGATAEPARTAAAPARAIAEPARAIARSRWQGGQTQDRALYSCSCGLAFDALVSTSVGCPHCGATQAW